MSIKLNPERFQRDGECSKSCISYKNTRVPNKHTNEEKRSKNKN